MLSGKDLNLCRVNAKLTKQTDEHALVLVNYVPVGRFLIIALGDVWDNRLARGMVVRSAENSP